MFNDVGERVQQRSHPIPSMGEGVGCERCWIRSTLLLLLLHAKIVTLENNTSHLLFACSMFDVIVFVLLTPTFLHDCPLHSEIYRKVNWGHEG